MAIKNKEMMAVVGSLILHLALFGFLTFTVNLPVDIGSNILDVRVFELGHKGAEHTQVKTDSKRESNRAQDIIKTSEQESEADSSPVYEATSKQLTRLPQIMREQKVEYPPVAKANGIQGTVTMRVVIDATGAIQSVEVLSGPGYGLNESAAQALKGFVFSPAYVDNRAVSVRFVYRYNFQIQ